MSIKVVSRRKPQYRGDKTISIEAQCTKGKQKGMSMGVMNLTRHSRGYYENDLNADTFDTVKEAKEYVKKNARQFIGPFCKK